MRLDASVRMALDDILAMLNADTARTAERRVAAGLFVPLAEFPDRGVQTSQAMRALADAKMLASGDSATGPIAHHEVSGQRVPGVIIAARHISGLAFPQGASGSAQDG